MVHREIYAEINILLANGGVAIDEFCLVVNEAVGHNKCHQIRLLIEVLLPYYYAKVTCCYLF